MPLELGPLLSVRQGLALVPKGLQVQFALGAVGGVCVHVGRAHRWSHTVVEHQGTPSDKYVRAADSSLAQLSVPGSNEQSFGCRFHAGLIAL